jgi:NAD(P)-dependent dehydrogenase (short-subunit alcohol dehydrogenase family)
MTVDIPPSGHPDFSGHRIFISGSTLGIGRAAAEAFHSLGARVAINGRTEESVQQTIRELGGGARLVPAAGNLAESSTRHETVRKALIDLGGLDTLINNAGRGDECLLERMTEEHWHQVVDLNLKAAFFTAQECTPALVKTRGSIINVSSILGLVAGPPGASVYHATKGAVIQMTRMMALALATRGVRVNVVCPGWIDTPMIRRENAAAGNDALYQYIASVVPMERIGTTNEVVGALLYLASRQNSYTTGAVLAADGGLSAGH